MYTARYDLYRTLRFYYQIYICISQREHGIQCFKLIRTLIFSLLLWFNYKLILALKTKFDEILQLSLSQTIDVILSCISKNSAMSQRRALNKDILVLCSSRFHCCSLDPSSSAFAFDSERSLTRSLKSLCFRRCSSWEPGSKGSSSLFSSPLLTGIFLSAEMLERGSSHHESQVYEQRRSKRTWCGLYSSYSSLQCLCIRNNNHHDSVAHAISWALQMVWPRACPPTTESNLCGSLCSRCVVPGLFS